jgi:hypothetical protein
MRRIEVTPRPAQIAGNWITSTQACDYSSHDHVRSEGSVCHHWALTLSVAPLSDAISAGRHAAGPDSGVFRRPTTRRSTSSASRTSAGNRGLGTSCSSAAPRESECARS